MGGLMADGKPLADDDPRLEHLKRATTDGDLVSGNPAANIVPADMEGAHAIASLITQGIANEAFVGFIRSTLMLNLCRKQLGQRSIAADPIGEKVND